MENRKNWNRNNREGQVRIIRTEECRPNDFRDQWERDQIYNGLDCAITHEVLSAILPQLDEVTGNTYDFSRSLQGPCLEMRLRGILVDHARKNEVIDLFYDQLDQLERQLEEIVLDGVGMQTFKWSSPKDLQRLFYDHLQIPIIRKQGRPTVDRNARERMEAYLIAKPIISHINLMWEIADKISVLKTGIDPDGRIRTSYNIAGTSTGRFSSSFSEFGTGGNLQNVEESLRSVLVADPGYKFAKFDAKSGESYCVGGLEWNLFKDDRYLNAVESGDVHTTVAKICWPGLPWTGNLKRDKEIAERPYYRHHTYRFMCKKLGHGSNYGGRPATLSQQAKLPESVVRDFQPKYFSAFPSHIRWHGWVDDQLRRVGYITSLTGRKRWFFGRRTEPATLREAIAYDPQGSLADIVNRAMLRIWRVRTALVVMQDHDALTFMYPEETEDEVIPKLQELLVEELPLKHDRTLAIPYDCKVGWNKGEYCCGDKTNPKCKTCHGRTNLDGLKDYDPKGDKRTRTPEVSVLDRIFR
jgi:DNA polymerase-1